MSIFLNVTFSHFRSCTVWRQIKIKYVLFTSYGTTILAYYNNISFHIHLFCMAHFQDDDNHIVLLIIDLITINQVFYA